MALAAMAVLLTLLATLPPIGAAVAAPVTERVDLGSTGEPADPQGGQASISTDADFVAFVSYSGGLVADDPYSETGQDVFVRDRLHGTTIRASEPLRGHRPSGESSEPAITPNGRYVAFTSGASNLVANDSNGNGDVFVRDLRRGVTTLVSAPFRGRPDPSDYSDYSWRPSISASGRYVAFASPSRRLLRGATPGPAGQPTQNVFVRDLKTRRTTIVSAPSAAGNEDGTDPSISADGRFVAFVGSFRGGRYRSSRIYVHDRRTGRTRRVDISSRGRPAHRASWDPVISATGRYIAFVSASTSLVPGDRNRGEDVFVRDVRRRVTIRVSIGPNGRPLPSCPRPDDEGLADPCFESPTLSSDGRYVGFDTWSKRFDGVTDGGAFVRDLHMRRTFRVGFTPDEKPMGGTVSVALSPEGSFVVYSLWAPGVFLRGPF